MSWFQKLTRGRLVTPARQGASAYDAPVPDGALARMAKFIPGEVVAVYLALDNALRLAFPKGAKPPTAGAEFWAPVGLVILCWVAGPVYFLKLEGEPGLRKKHALMAVIAFPAWAYASGGIFQTFGVHSPLLAVVGIGAATIMGMFIGT